MPLLNFLLTLQQLHLLLNLKWVDINVSERECFMVFHKMLEQSLKVFKIILQLILLIKYGPGTQLILIIRDSEHTLPLELLPEILPNVLTESL